MGGMNSAGRALARLLAAEVERLGGEVLKVENGHKHPHLIYRDPTGRVDSFIFSGSPSDSVHGNLNSITKLRRRMRGIGAMGIKR
jgi:hypothetical protein